MQDETVNEQDISRVSTPTAKKFPWDYYAKDSELKQKHLWRAKSARKKDRYGVYHSDRIVAIRLFENKS